VVELVASVVFVLVSTPLVLIVEENVAAPEIARVDDRDNELNDELPVTVNVPPIDTLPVSVDVPVILSVPLADIFPVADTLGKLSVFNKVSVVIVAVLNVVAPVTESVLWRVVAPVTFRAPVSVADVLDNLKTSVSTM
jgi:hypothetical protein